MGKDFKENRIHWTSWDTLCYRKAEGGLGLRKLNLFNQILLAKQGWYFITCLDSFLARLFKSLYHPNSSFLEAKRGKTHPFIGKNSCGKDLFFAKDWVGE